MYQLDASVGVQHVCLVAGDFGVFINPDERGGGLPRQTEYARWLGTQHHRVFSAGRHDAFYFAAHGLVDFRGNILGGACRLGDRLIAGLARRVDHELKRKRRARFGVHVHQRKIVADLKPRHVNVVHARFADGRFRGVEQINGHAGGHASNDTGAGGRGGATAGVFGVAHEEKVFAGARRWRCARRGSARWLRAPCRCRKNNVNY